MLRIMKSRITGRSGFTLSETLMAILILLMVTSIVAAGIPVAANAYSKVVMASNAQLLLSTTMTNLRDELATATNIEVVKNDDDVKIRYKNDKGGDSEIFQITLASEDENKLGVYVKEVSGTQKHTYLLVSDRAATENLYLTYEIDGYDGGGVIKFSSLKVKKIETGEDRVISEIENFEIRVLTVK